MTQLIFGLIGGTALLMYGVDKMGDGLEKAAGSMMRKILTALTGNVYMAFLVGIVTTVLVQSSTAITVLTVGFVNAGLMKLPQAVGIIFGANIGTTITAQLMAFSFHFKLTDIALPVLGLGFAISYFSKKPSIKHLGDALFGFGVMFLGLKILNSGIPFVKDNEDLKFFFEVYASNPFVGVLLGAVATALVHSSSATVALVMFLGASNLITLETAIYLMLGDNIGTCITAQMASMAGNIHARRTAWAHTLYNIFGVVLVMITFPLFFKSVQVFTQWTYGNDAIANQIANSHTLFNVFSAVVFLPFTKVYVKFLETVIRTKEKFTEIRLNELLLATPVAAFKASLEELNEAVSISKGMFNSAADTIVSGNQMLLKSIENDESRINQMQHEMTRYMVEVAKNKLSDEESALVPAFINSINNIERVGDHAIDMSKFAIAKIERGFQFSDDTYSELNELKSILNQMFDNVTQMLESRDSDLFQVVSDFEDQVDILTSQYAHNHYKRLEQGVCSVEGGVLFVDILNHIERIADHLYKVARIGQESMSILKS